MSATVWKTHFIWEVTDTGIESHTYDVIGGTGEGRLGTSWEVETGEGREAMEPG